MWSKRLRDIRPSTVVGYTLFLLVMGLVRVLSSEGWLGVFTTPNLNVDWSFLGVEYTVSRGVVWALPILWTGVGLVMNSIITERFQLLKRHSYLGFLSGMSLVVLGDLKIVAYTFFMLIWFASVLHVQRSNNKPGDFLDIGLILGVILLFDIRFIAIVPLTWVLLLIFARLGVRAIGITVWGMINIHILAVVITWLTVDLDRYLFLYQLPEWHLYMPTDLQWGWLGVSTLWWVISLGNFTVALSRANIVKRQSLTALFVIVVSSALLAGFGIWDQNLYLAAVFTSALVFISNDLQYRKKSWWKDTVILSYVLLLVLAFMVELVNG